MTQLEYFKAWAAKNHPNLTQTVQQYEDDKLFFFIDSDLNMMWQAFQYALTIRPTTTMENGTFNKAEFRKDDSTTIVDRLRGIYPNIDKPYPTSLVMQEAAREIERLREEMEVVGILWKSRVSSSWGFNPEMDFIKPIEDTPAFEYKLVYAYKKKPAEAG